MEMQQPNTPSIPIANNGRSYSPPEYLIPSIVNNDSEAGDTPQLLAVIRRRFPLVLGVAISTTIAIAAAPVTKSQHSRVTFSC
ncbi:MAG: hypothetical protein HC936_08690 [Leptolyngbyaceae cyanobacterium SU_3_3]|nr:hypothetical protein [Leptolyngbyaceae cyanobacterium SU_3_3]